MLLVLREPHFDLITALVHKESKEESLLSLGREECYDLLKLGSNQDFGYDVNAWKQWFEDPDNLVLFWDNLEAVLQSRKRLNSRQAPD